MKSRPLFFGRLLLLPAAALISFSGSAQAVAITWDDGFGDDLWSSGTNWSAPDAVPTSLDDITFGATGASTTAGTVTNIVDANTTIRSLLFTNTGTATHTTQINDGQTLTVSGALAGAFTVNNTTAGSSNVTFTGLGTLAVTGGQTTTSFNVGSANAAAGGTTQVLNMAGLANFSASVASFNIGNGQRGAGTVTLGTTNSITATTVLLGGNTTTGGNTSNLHLGQANTINAGTLTVGSGRSGGSIQYRTGLTGATTSIRGTAGGVTRAAVNIGNVGNVSASGVGQGNLDFSGGSVDAMFSTVNMGQGASGTGTGGGGGTLTLGLGTIDATTITAGIGSSATGTANTGTGTINLNANAGTLTVGTLVLGNQTNTGGTVTSNAVGTFNQNGGTAAITTLTLANRTATGAANVTANYNLAAGTLKAQTIQAGSNGTGAGTVTRNFNWTGGAIQNLNGSTDLTIASTNGLTLSLNGASTLSFTPDSARSITVNAAMNGANGFTQNGAGTTNLTSATNGYLGATSVSAGTLLVSAGSINSSSGVTINGSTAKYAYTSATAGTNAIALTQGTLDGTGTVGAVTVAAAGTAASKVVANGNITSNTALTLSSLIFDGTGTTSLRLAGGATTTSPALAVTGALTLSGAAGSVKVNLAPTAALENGSTYQLISYGGAFTGTASTDFTMGTGLTGRQAGTFASTAASNGFITLAVTGDNPVWSGAASNVLTEYAQNAGLTTGNLALKTGLTATDSWTSDSVEFNDTYNVGAGAVAVTQTTVNINGGATNAGGIAANSFTFNNSAVDYSITSSDGTGLTAGSIAKNGTGKVTINNANSYTGSTTINAGRLNIQNSSALGATSGVAVASGAALELQGGISVGNQPLNISGAGLTASPAGALRSVSGTNSYAGLVALGANAAIQSDADSLALTNIGTITGSGFNLTLAGAGNGSIAGIIGTGAGALTKSGAGAWTLSGANTYSGGTTLSTGTLNIDNAGSGGTSSAIGTGTFTIDGGTINNTSGSTKTLSSNNAQNWNGDFTFTGSSDLNLGTGSVTMSGARQVTVSAGNLTVGGVVTGSGLLTKEGNGRLTLNGNNSGLTGNIALNAGTLALGNSAAAGLSTGTITAANGTTIFANVGSGAVGAAITLSGTNANVTLTNNHASGGINSLITGSADQTLTISTAGGTGVNMNLQNAKQFQNFLGTVSIAASQYLTFRSTQLNQGGDDTLFEVNGGLSTRNGGDVALGGLTGSGSVSLGSAGGSVTFTIGARGGNDNFSGVISDNSATNKAIVVKTGSGIQTFSGTNTYTGTTTIKAGTLTLDATGTIANSTKIVVGDTGSSGAVLDVSAKSGGFIIGSSQMLSGIGTVDANDAGTLRTVTIEGTHAVGNSPGLQTVDGNLAYASGSIFEWDLAANKDTDGLDDLIGATGDNGVAGTDYDAVTVTGTLDIASDAVFKVIQNAGASFSDTFWTNDQSWSNIFNVTGSITSGWSNAAVSVYNTANVLQDVSSYGSFTINGSTLEWSAFSAVPEPSSALVGLLVGAGLLRRRRSA